MLQFVVNYLNLMAKLIEFSFSLTKKDTKVSRSFSFCETKSLQFPSISLENKRTGKKNTVTFTEGWVEFEKKKIAKWVAQNLNAQSISTKKGSKFCDILWNLKYLSGFKWIHLSERLTYERTVANQKLRLATSKARHEANFFQNNIDKSEKIKKFKNKKKLN